MRYFILLTAAAVLLAGCQGESEPLEQTIEGKYDLAPTGSLSVTNKDGSIHVYCSDLPGLELEATKRAYSAERLAEIRVQVSAHDGSISIATSFPPKKKWSLSDRSGTVDYTLIVPQKIRITNLELVNGEVSVEGLRGGSVKASLTNGRIGARNCFGDLDFRAANGNIDFFYNWWEKKPYSVKAVIANGGVGFFAPRDASFRVQAKTATGRTMGNLVGEEETDEPVRNLETIVGSDPGPAFQMATESGNITINGY